MRKHLSRWLIPACWAYYTLLFGWLLVYLLTGDRFGMVGLVTNLSLYMFAPLPVGAVLAGAFKRRELWVGAGLGLLAFSWLWSDALISLPVNEELEGETLLVMSYNVLGWNRESGVVLDVLREVDADVVFLQEVNIRMANVIRRDLADAYPYQILDPVDNVTGMGVISKFPLRDSGERLRKGWIGVPQVLVMDLRGIEIRLVNFHMYATHISLPSIVTDNFRAREEQARAFVEYVNSVEGPIIVAGDANANHLTDAYKIVTEDLQDAWMEAGLGPGHTFPGSARWGSSRLRIAGWPVPQWLVRIDFIFHDDSWAAVDAYLGPFDGVSDHRPVVAELLLIEE